MKAMMKILGLLVCLSCYQLATATDCVALVMVDPHDSASEMEGVHGLLEHLTEKLLEQVCGGARRQLLRHDMPARRDQNGQCANNCDLYCQCCPGICAALCFGCRRRELEEEPQKKPFDLDEAQDNFVVEAASFDHPRERALDGSKDLVELCGFSELSGWPATLGEFKDTIFAYVEETPGVPDHLKSIWDSSFHFLYDECADPEQCAAALAD
eukprot:CAMPEP_0172449096 /NCGR_PEP_ID=MMETSP1065-20121228/7897_1 /TAXON_ID=265537 /ORGANISM="Amphiprora paludosa, Strain CCMP125" /LENGTH=211 /DNA_ID=CAMNT_0013200695 /DNA_START=157 /DNA_END=792 /DNA_ORIENTATION=+